MPFLVGVCSRLVRDTTANKSMACDDEYCDDDYDELIEWYEAYQKRKAQKALIKEELIPIAWHPSRWWNWCIPEDEKKETENFWE